VHQKLHLIQRRHIFTQLTLSYFQPSNSLRTTHVATARGGESINTGQPIFPSLTQVNPCTTIHRQCWQWPCCLLLFSAPSVRWSCRRRRKGKGTQRKKGGQTCGLSPAVGVSAHSGPGNPVQPLGKPSYSLQALLEAKLFPSRSRGSPPARLCPTLQRCLLSGTESSAVGQLSVAWKSTMGQGSHSYCTGFGSAGRRRVRLDVRAGWHPLHPLHPFAK
jgi:hypothetical protein